MNMFWKLFPEVTYIPSLNCASQVKKQNWPVVPGEYFAFCDGSDCPVAVSTLASVELAEKLASLRPKGLCIVGKTETENIGIEKVIKNTITNPTIHFLILAGKDPKGHHSGQTLLALYENGIDDNMKVIGSLGKRPILKNVSFVEVEKFRKQVQVINIIGCEDIKKIIDKIEELSREATSTCECKECSELMSIVRTPSVPKILASKPKKLKMDKAPGKEVKTK
jgi:tetrahydromethanopterin S-methyltransferase subunit A